MLLALNSLHHYLSKYKQCVQSTKSRENATTPGRQEEEEQFYWVKSSTKYFLQVPHWRIRKDVIVLVVNHHSKILKVLNDDTSTKNTLIFFHSIYFHTFFVHTADEMAHKRRVQLIFLPCVIKKGFMHYRYLTSHFPLAWLLRLIPALLLITDAVSLKFSTFMKESK